MALFIWAVNYDPTLQASRLFDFRWKCGQWRRLSRRRSRVLRSYSAGNRRFGGVVYLGGGAVYYDHTLQASRLFTLSGSTDSGAFYLGGGAVYYDPTLQ